MDSQLARTHGQSYEQNPNDVGLHAEDEVHDHDREHHHEKKSVLKKVKAKAKKIKDTIKLHGHNHDHDQADHVHDDHDLDEEDEEDEERFEDPKVHGVPIYESTAIRFTSIPGQVQSSGQPAGMDFERSTERMTEDPPAPRSSEPSKVNLGKLTVQGEEVPQAPQNTPIPVAPGTYTDSNPSRTSLHEQEHPGQPKVNLERPNDLEEDLHGQNVRPDPSHYQTKVTDPTGTGGEEAGITPIVHSFDKMNISEGTEQKHETEQKQSKSTETENQFPNLPTGSHDQFTPEPGPPRPLNNEDEPLLVPHDTDLATSQADPHDATAEKPSSQSSYTEKIPSVTSSVAAKAVSAKNVVASRLGYGEKDETGARDTHEGEETTKPASPVEYGKKIAATVTEKLTPVYEKVTETGSSVMSKMKVSQSTNTGNRDESKGEIKGQDKGISMRDYFAEKLRPGEEDKALSEVISNALQKRKEETKPMGKVTESEEVARRLGATDEKSEERVDSGSVNSPGKGVVDRMKVAVSSWFNKGDESQPTQQSLGSSHGNEGVEGERQLQESSN